MKEEKESTRISIMNTLMNNSYTKSYTGYMFDLAKDNVIRPLSAFYENRYPLLTEKLYNNKYFTIPVTFIEQCNHKNLIELKIENSNHTVSYTDRKICVLGLSIGTLVLNVILHKGKKMKTRWIVPYFLAYSLLFCRENLDPFAYNHN